MQKPTRMELEEWQSSDVTKWIFDLLRKDKHILIETLESGGTLSADAGATAQLTARCIGEISGLNHILESDFSEFLDEEKNAN